MTTNLAFLISDPILVTVLILATILIRATIPPLPLALINKCCRSPQQDILVLYLPASLPASQERDPTHLMAVETWECKFMEHHIVHQL
jgi:hypothetical protein